MDPRKLSFLQAVIGNDGAGALTKATSRHPDLEWAIFPRVVMSWLEIVSHVGAFNETLPGTNVNLNFRKAEDSFSGHVSIGPEIYGFRDATLYHVAGAVAVALGAGPEHAPELKSPSLAKLGKSRRPAGALADTAQDGRAGEDELERQAAPSLPVRARRRQDPSCTPMASRCR
jgi:hypothetical protein